MPFIPVPPSISDVTSSGFKITKNSDGNPGSTHYSFRIVFNTTTKFVNGSGTLQDDPVFLLVSDITVTNAIPNTIHSVSLSAADDALGTNESAFGTAAVVTTLSAFPIAKSFSNIFATTVMSNWSTNGNPVGTKYFVELSPDPGFLFTVVNSGWILTVGHQFTGLDRTTTYFGRVKARNTSLVETSFVSLGSVVTLNGPDTVKALHVFNLLAERGFLLKWQPNLETDLASYKVYRSSSPTDNDEFKVIATTPTNVTSYIDQVPFTFGIVFYYKITAVDAGGNESVLSKTTPVHDNTFHSFEEQPFPSTVNTIDFVEDEQPQGLVNGVNTLYTTTFPYRPNTLEVYLNGVRMHRTLDFTEGPLSQQFVFLDPPDSGGNVRVSYIRF